MYNIDMKRSSIQIISMGNPKIPSTYKEVNGWMIFDLSSKKIITKISNIFPLNGATRDLSM